MNILLVKYLVLFTGAYAAPKECGDNSTVDLDNLDLECEILNGSLEVYTERTESNRLQEVTGNITIHSEFPSNLMHPLKTKGLWFKKYADIRDPCFSQLTVEETCIIESIQSIAVLNTEPVKFVLKLGEIRSVTGFLGTRLKHIEIDTKYSQIANFSRVESLDILRLNSFADFGIVPNLKTAKTIVLKDYQVDLDTSIEAVDTFLVQFLYDEARNVRLHKLKSIKNYMRLSGLSVRFSAPELLWGRLVFKTELETLELNKNLSWEGTAEFYSKDFCEKYFEDFAIRGLNFNTSNNCQAKCEVPLNSAYNLKLINACPTLSSLTLNKDSVENIVLDGPTALSGDLVIDNYSSKISVKSLNEIAGSVTINEYNSFEAPNLKTITGDLKITNCRHFSAPNLEEIQGSVTVYNSSFISTPKLMKILANLTTENSNDIDMPRLNEIKGDLELTNSTRNFFFSLEGANRVNVKHQSTDLEFKNMHSISSLSISQSSLTNITGINVDHLDNLVLEDCPNLKANMLVNLRTVANLDLIGAVSGDLSLFFPSSLTVTNDVKIKHLLHEHLSMPLLVVGGQLTLEENSNLKYLSLLAEYLNEPLKNIGNPKLQFVKFNDMKIDYKLDGSFIKAAVASTKQEESNSGVSSSNYVNTSTGGLTQTHSSPGEKERKDDELVLSNQEATNRNNKISDLNIRNYLKIYITVVIPLALLATIIVFVYLK